MFALAKAAKGFQACHCLGVQGRGTDEMLELARHGEKLAAETDPRIVFISRPADDCRTQKDLEREICGDRLWERVLKWCAK